MVPDVASVRVNGVNLCLDKLLVFLKRFPRGLVDCEELDVARRDVSGTLFADIVVVVAVVLVVVAGSKVPSRITCGHLGPMFLGDVRALAPPALALPVVALAGRNVLRLLLALRERHSSFVRHFCCLLRLAWHVLEV